MVLQFFSLPQGADNLIDAAADVSMRTYGGGEGYKTVLKFDISAIPAGQIIDSAFINIFVRDTNGSFDGDMVYMRLANQDWQEGDSSHSIIDMSPFGQVDTVVQLAGFGLDVGWSYSVDIKKLVVLDYDSGHTYFSVILGDPDDMTFMPGPIFPMNSPESLLIGDALFDSTVIVCYPREFASAPPRLHVYYHNDPTVKEADRIMNAGSLTLNAFPNPFMKSTHIRYSLATQGRVVLSIYSIQGQRVCGLVRGLRAPGTHSAVWDGLDMRGKRVAEGVYLCCLKSGEGTIIKKLFLGL
jgi:hypothetical protein